MVVEILIGGAIIAVGVALAAMIKLRRENRRLIDIIRTMLPANENGEIEYVPEDCDIQMAQRCRELVEREFPNGVSASLSCISLGERKKRLESFVSQASKEMGVSAPIVEFDQSSSCAGGYSFSKDVLVISEVFIANDSDLNDCINTVFHELKHKVQHEATKKGGNKWGYSNHLVALWDVNFRKYIHPDIDPLGYHVQIVEVDARGFANSII